MTKQENVRAILESMFPELKDELIDIAVKNIIELKAPADKDAISRKTVMRLFGNNTEMLTFHEAWILRKVKELPPITTNRHKGHWIPIPYQLDYDTDAICSLCHEEFIAAINYKYCPNCGAKMEDNENDTI